MAGLSIAMDDALIEVAGLAKSFGRRRAVRDVSLRVGRGELVALTGANGSGKTTTIRMLAGLIWPDGGHGHVLGAEVMKGKRDRRRIGYMSQRAALYPELSIAENLRFRAASYGLNAKAYEEAILEHGLADYAAARFGNLSGGWQRRAQFAAATLHRPDLLLLDEPTAGLDVPAQSVMWTAIQAAARRGCAVVVSTHDGVDPAIFTQLVPFHNGRSGFAAPARGSEL